MKIYRLAQVIKVSRPRLSDIVLGRRSVTIDTALRFGRYFGTPPEFWINLQTRYNLDVAERRMTFGVRCRLTSFRVKWQLWTPRFKIVAPFEDCPLLGSDSPMVTGRPESRTRTRVVALQGTPLRGAMGLGENSRSRAAVIMRRSHAETLNVALFAEAGERPRSACVPLNGQQLLTWRTDVRYVDS